MNHTTNYNLNQWEASDRVTRADFNADNAAIDAAIAAVSAAAAGAPRFVYGSYRGTGTYGFNSPTTLDFDFEPKLLIVKSGPQIDVMFVLRESTASPLITDVATLAYAITRWNGNSVSFINTSNARCQMNENNTTYYYIALG